jgi:YggT family protein
MSGSLIHFIGWLIEIFAYLVIARALTSWFPNARQHPLVRLLYQVTDPVMVPASRLIPRIGMVDISPMLVVFGLLFISSAIRGA